jgi:hypothetical protein
MLMALTRAQQTANQQEDGETMGSNYIAFTFLELAVVALFFLFIYTVG